MWWSTHLQCMTPAFGLNHTSVCISGTHPYDPLSVLMWWPWKSRSGSGWLISRIEQQAIRKLLDPLALRVKSCWAPQGWPGQGGCYVFDSWMWLSNQWLVVVMTEVWPAECSVWTMKGSRPSGWGTSRVPKLCRFRGLGCIKTAYWLFWDSDVGVKSSDGFCLLRGLHVMWG